MFWTDNFLGKIRQDWLNRIDKIQYYAGGSWHTAQITSKTVKGNTIEILSQTTDSQTITITQVRLIDINGDIAGQCTESISKLSTQGVITLWEFPLYEIDKAE